MRLRGTVPAIAALCWPAIALATNTITVDTTTVNLSYTLKSEVIPSQPVKVTTNASVLVAPQVLNSGTPTPFLVVNPVSCPTGTCTLTVQADTTTLLLDRLAPGKYTGTFQVISSFAASSPIVTVTLNVVAAAPPPPAGPTITATPSSIFLTAPQFPAPAANTTQAPRAAISNIDAIIPALSELSSSGANQNVTITTDQPWITVAKAAVVPGEGGGTYRLHIAATTTNLPLGTNTANIYVSLPGSTEPVATIKVKVQVDPTGDSFVYSASGSDPVAFIGRGIESIAPSTVTLTEVNGSIGDVQASTQSSDCPNTFSAVSSGAADGNGNIRVIVDATPPASGLPSTGCTGALLLSGSNFTATRPLTLVDPPLIGFLGEHNAASTAKGLVVANDGSEQTVSGSGPEDSHVTFHSFTTPTLVTIQPPPPPGAGSYSSNFFFGPATGGTPSSTPPVSFTYGAQEVLVTPQALTFNLPLNAGPATQTFQISGGPSDFTLSHTSDNWLSAQQPGAQGTVPANGSVAVSVTVDPRGVAEATSVGYVNVNVPESSTIISVPVTLIIANSLNSPTLTFSEASTDAPVVYMNALGLGSEPIQVTASIDPPSLGSVKPATATVRDGTPTGFRVTCGGPGIGTLDVTGEGWTRKHPIVCPSLRTAVLTASRSGVGQYVRAAGSTAPSDTIQLTSSGNPGASYALIAPNFLSVTPATGKVSQTITVTPAVPSTLSPGSYLGKIIIAASEVPDPLTISANLVIGTAPAVTAVNAASSKPGPASPGEIVSVFGTDIGPTPAVGLTLTPSGSVSTTLGNTEVLFDGVAAPLTYAGSGQINAIAPYEIGGKLFTNVTVLKNGTTVGQTVLAVTDSNPGIFAILNQDHSANGKSTPAAPGSVITVFATGEGPLAPAVPTGSLTPSTPPFPAPVLPVSATIGGKPAIVQYAGEAPGLVSGVMQVNAIIPPVSSGDYTVVVTVGGNSSPQSVTITVK